MEIPKNIYYAMQSPHLADNIIYRLYVAGGILSKSELYHAFDHRVRAADIDKALAVLIRLGKVTMTRTKLPNTKGRPVRRYAISQGLV